MRNKAAEKAKHAVTNSACTPPSTGQGPVSVIAHAPASQHDRYSINGILGIPQHHDHPAKRKRDLDINPGKSFYHECKDLFEGHLVLLESGWI